MSITTTNTPRVALHDLAQLFVPNVVPTGVSIELSIKIRHNNLSTRGFGEYFSLADRVYGRMTDVGLESYAQSKNNRLTISEIRFGSVEIIFREAVAQTHDAIPIVVLGLFLKYFPPIIKASSEAAKNFADAYKAVQEGRTIQENRKHLAPKATADLVRSEAEVRKLTAEANKLTEDSRFSKENRKQLRSKLKEDEVTQQLTSTRIGQIASLLDRLYAQEHRALPSSGEFAHTSVEAVSITAKRSEDARSQP